LSKVFPYWPHTLTRPKDNKNIDKHSDGLNYLKYTTFGGLPVKHTLI